MFWANSTSTPVALASTGGGFIYTFVVFYSHGINNVGKMVGYAYTPGFATLHAVLWTSSSSPAVVLNTVGEFSNAVAAGISDNGKIVGYCGYDATATSIHIGNLITVTMLYWLQATGHTAISLPRRPLPPESPPRSMPRPCRSAP